MIPCRLIIRFLAAAALSATLTATAAAGEQWYRFSIGETPVGYLSETTRADGDSIISETRLSARLVRLGKGIDMRFVTTARETAGGGLQSLSQETTLSAQTTHLDAWIDTAQIVISTRSGQGGTEHKRTVDTRGARIIGPREIHRITRQRLRQPGDTMAYTVFSPEMQRVVSVRRKVLASGERIACNEAVAMKIEESVEGLPAPRILWIDSEAVMIADSLPGPFGPMTTCRTSREGALAAGGELPADLYEQTLARSNVRMLDPAGIDRIVLRIRMRDEAMELPDFASDNQRVLERGPRHAIVEIRRPAATAQTSSRGTPSPEYVTPNAMIESNNEQIIRMAREITSGKNGALAAAEALTKWVFDEMKMDAGIVMAPASELMRDRRGTCAGYATLLASLARATAIPSRVAMGYVYYGGIWGGHAWTEMWIDGQWLPFDAAVYAPGVASATRLAAGANSFHDGGFDLNTALARLFGRVEIEIIEYEGRGRKVRVPPAVAAWDVSGTTYTNQGLGLKIDAGEWKIEKAASTWPSSLVVAFRRGPMTIELHERLRSAADRVEPDEGSAMFVSRFGDTLLIWSAAGPGAAGALRDFLTRVEMKQRS